jgi:3-deoxy-manno-octulosonate cytidylyltransferase (CMP-KDO synthetase)
MPPDAQSQTPEPDGRAVAIIPARMASTRFPRKMLADRTGLPLVVHTLRAARASGAVRRVVVAADDRAIAEAVERAGGEAVLTSPDHPNGTSRLREAADLLGLADGEVVVNVQGDEPEVPAAFIDRAVEALARSGAEVATVASPFAPGQRGDDPNIVKVVRDARGLAMYFSRSPVPFDRDGAGVERLKHIGLYAYRAGFLRRYASLPETPCERAERLEQLRVLEHGFSVAVAVVEAHHAGIDTPEQYEAFVARQARRDAG